MICAWKELLQILPDRLKYDVDRLGRETLTELRLRLGAPVELVMAEKICRIGPRVTREELTHCVNAVSRYSPWTSATATKGYLTAAGGHRVGLCGEVVVKDGKVSGIRDITSLCIRVARDIPGIADKAGSIQNSVLIIGAPGWGKTTLLRDLARSVSREHTVCVVDERGELFPSGVSRGIRMDVLSGPSKAQGIGMLLQCMGPEYIAVDEITAQEDTKAILEAHGCGVKLLATAHAGSLNEFNSRMTYRKLIENNVFTTLLILRSNKSYTLERIKI